MEQILLNDRFGHSLSQGGVADNEVVGIDLT